jgi:hypothetical protein
MTISNSFIMKIRISLSLLFALLVTISFAQVSQETINKSKNYINYKLTNYCIDKYVSSKDGAESKPVYDSIKANLLSKNLEDTFNYKSLSTQISNKFAKVKTKLSGKIDSLDFAELTTMKNEDIANIIVGKTLGIYDIQYGKKFPLKKDSFKIMLEKELLEFFNKNILKVEPKKNRTSELNKNLNDTSSKNPVGEFDQNSFFTFSSFTLWNLLSLLFLVCSLIFMLSRISNLNDRIEKMKGDSRRMDVANINSNNNNLTHIADMDMINDLKKSILELNQKVDLIESKKDSSMINETQGNKKSLDEVQQKNNNNVFYMMKPVDNYFPNSSKSFNKSNTVYKFTVSKNQTEAQYEIHVDQTTANDIAKRNEQYLKPACIEENMPNNEVKNIITLHKGLVSLEGDKWIIKTKAIIKYE